MSESIKARIKYTQDSLVKAIYGENFELNKFFDLSVKNSLSRREHEFKNVGIWEILQNINDYAMAIGEKTDVSFLFSSNELIIKYRARDFSIDDVGVILDGSTNRHDKQDNPKFSGEKGLGFKSYFTFTDHLEITSGNSKIIFNLALLNKELKIELPEKLVDIWMSLPKYEPGNLPENNIQLKFILPSSNVEGLKNIIKGIRHEALTFYRYISTIYIDDEVYYSQPEFKIALERFPNLIDESCERIGIEQNIGYGEKEIELEFVIPLSNNLPLNSFFTLNSIHNFKPLLLPIIFNSRFILTNERADLLLPKSSNHFPYQWNVQTLDAIARVCIKVIFPSTFNNNSLNIKLLLATFTDPYNSNKISLFHSKKTTMDDEDLNYNDFFVKSLIKHLDEYEIKNPCKALFSGSELKISEGHTTQVPFLYLLPRHCFEKPDLLVHSWDHEVIECLRLLIGKKSTAKTSNITIKKLKEFLKKDVVLDEETLKKIYDILLFNKIPIYEEGVLSLFAHFNLSEDERFECDFIPSPLLLEILRSYGSVAPVLFHKSTNPTIQESIRKDMKLDSTKKILSVQDLILKVTERMKQQLSSGLSNDEKAKPLYLLIEKLINTDLIEIKPSLVIEFYLNNILKENIEAESLVPIFKLLNSKYDFVSKLSPAQIDFIKNRKMNIHEGVMFEPNYDFIFKSSLQADSLKKICKLLSINNKIFCLDEFDATLNRLIDRLQYKLDEFKRIQKSIIQNLTNTECKHNERTLIDATNLLAKSFPGIQFSNDILVATESKLVTVVNRTVSVPLASHFPYFEKLVLNNEYEENARNSLEKHQPKTVLEYIEQHDLPLLNPNITSTLDILFTNIDQNPVKGWLDFWKAFDPSDLKNSRDWIGEKLKFFSCIILDDQCVRPDSIKSIRNSQIIKPISARQSILQFFKISNESEDSAEVRNKLLGPPGDLNPESFEKLCRMLISLDDKHREELITNYEQINIITTSGIIGKLSNLYIFSEDDFIARFVGPVSFSSNLVVNPKDNCFKINNAATKFWNSIFLKVTKNILVPSAFKIEAKKDTGKFVNLEKLIIRQVNELYLVESTPKVGALRTKGLSWILDKTNKGHTFLFNMEINCEGHIDIIAKILADALKDADLTQNLIRLELKEEFLKAIISPQPSIQNKPQKAPDKFIITDKESVSTPDPIHKGKTDDIRNQTCPNEIPFPPINELFSEDRKDIDGDMESISSKLLQIENRKENLIYCAEHKDYLLNFLDELQENTHNSAGELYISSGWAKTSKNPNLKYGFAQIFDKLIETMKVCKSLKVTFAFELNDFKNGAYTSDPDLHNYVNSKLKSISDIKLQHNLKSNLSFINHPQLHSKAILFTSKNQDSTSARDNNFLIIGSHNFLSNSGKNSIELSIKIHDIGIVDEVQCFFELIRGFRQKKSGIKLD